MKVLLLQQVPKLGQAGVVKDVSEGYYRNFLQPHKLATVASEKLIADIAHKEQEKQKKEEVRKAAVRESVQNISKLSLTMAREADAKGTLYAAVAPKDIVAKLKEYKCVVEEKHIHIDGHIKTAGDYMVKVSPEPGVEGVLKIKVVRKL